MRRVDLRFVGKFEQFSVQAVVHHFRHHLRRVTFAAGEIRFRETRAGVIVEMNVDGDARAEMSILIRGSGTLDVNDFLC